MNVPRLMLLTDRNQLRAGRDLVETVRACAGAGLSHVVVREHDIDTASRQQLLAELAEIAGLVLITSRVPYPGAAGLHLAADQAAPGSGWFGRSCHTTEEVGRAAAEGAAYATLSPFAASPSKPGYGPPVDRDAFAGHAIPLLALGGIDARNAASARAVGAHGVAVMGCVMRASSPAATVTRLLSEVGG